MLRTLRSPEPAWAPHGSVQTAGQRDKSGRLHAPTMHDIVEFLRRHAPFDDLSEAELEELAKSAEVDSRRRRDDLPPAGKADGACASWSAEARSSGIAGRCSTAG